MPPETLIVSEVDLNIKEELKSRGVNATKPVFFAGDLRVYECPITLLTNDTRNILKLIFDIDRYGHLLHEGGLGNQPPWLIEALALLNTEKANREE